MNEYLDQISFYFETVPLWPFYLFGLIGLAALAIELINRKRKEDALFNYRYTIETELSGMYPKPINWPENVNRYLCTRLPEMQDNFETLRVFLPQHLLKDYNNDWNKYRDFCISITDEKCLAYDESTDSEPDPKEVFHTLITNLLTYPDRM